MKTRTIKYNGSLYTRVAYTNEDLLTYEQIRMRGAVEIGDAYGPDNKWNPGWADIDGKKFAHVDALDESMRPIQQFLRVDNLEGWRWEWMEGHTQEDVIEMFESYNEAKRRQKNGSTYTLAEDTSNTNLVVKYIIRESGWMHDLLEEAKSQNSRFRDILKEVVTEDLLRKVPKVSGAAEELMNRSLKDLLKYVNWNVVAKRAKAIAEEDYGTV